MATLEQEIKQSKFDNELLKANINVLFTANFLYNKITGYLKPYAVTHEQFNVLRILNGSFPKCMCQKEILSRMIAPNSNLTLIIKKLVSKNLIQVIHSTTDKREYQINITEAGIALLQEIEIVFKQNEFKINNLSVSESFHLNALLDKMRD